MQGETVFQALDTAGSEAQNRQTDTCRELTVVWPGRSLAVFIGVVGVEVRFE